MGKKSEESYLKRQRYRNKTGHKTVPPGNLTEQVLSGKVTDLRKSRLWPTPTEHGNHNRKGMSKNSGDGLSTAVKMLPTPTNSMVTEGDLNQAMFNSKNRPEYKEVNSGSLNPAWTEWLQGYPPGWTSLTSQESQRESPIEPTDLNASETP